MKVASWNVNSLRVRLPQVLDWLEATKVDVLGVQETKTQDTDFPLDALREAGYHTVFSGQKTYNGVALMVREDTMVSRYGELRDIVVDLPKLDDPQRRVLVATLGDVRIANLYIPNGSKPDSDKYQYKLTWLQKLHDFLQLECEQYDKLLVMGDFNIAPEDADVHDPAAWEGEVLVSPPERQAFSELLALGFVDSFRHFEQPEGQYSWWDYRAASFRRNHGVRIDIILSTPALTQKLAKSWIDQEPRTWERPSDHTPVVAEFTL